jgi:hypothetical protein
MQFAGRVLGTILSIDVQVLNATMVPVLGYLTAHGINTQDVYAYPHVCRHVSQMLSCICEGMTAKWRETSSWKSLVRMRAQHYRSRTFTGRTLAQDAKGSNKQITFSKGTSFHDVLLKRRKASQTDYRQKGVLSHLQSRGNKGKLSGKWKDPLRAHNL